MSVRREIGGTDSDGNDQTLNLLSRGEGAGLIAYTDDLIKWKQRSIFFVSEDGSRDMNVDGAFGGTPIGIHNGTDTTEWTATATVGTWDFASTTQAHSGTKSIEALNMSDGDMATIAKGSDQTFVGYTTLTGWVYLTRFNTSLQQIMLTWHDDSVIVGNTINILDYIDGGTLNAWQQFAIPKGDFGLNGSTIDEVLISFAVSGGSAPRAYFDDIQIEQTGGIQFTAQPAQGKIFEFQRYELLFVDAMAGTVTGGTMPGLSYDKILGLSSLAVGFGLQRFEGTTPQISLSMKNISDMLGFTLEYDPPSSDGTNTMLKVVGNLPVPSRLDGNRGDKIVITINDDMEGLILFRGIIVGKEMVD